MSLKLIKYSPVTGSGFYEEGGKFYEIGFPYKKSKEVTEEFTKRYFPENIFHPNKREFDGISSLVGFLKEKQVENIRLNPKLTANRSLLIKAEKNELPSNFANEFDVSHQLSSLKSRRKLVILKPLRDIKISQIFRIEIFVHPHLEYLVDRVAVSKQSFVGRVVEIKKSGEVVLEKIRSIGRTYRRMETIYVSKEGSNRYSHSRTIYVSKDGPNRYTEISPIENKLKSIKAKTISQEKNRAIRISAVSK